MNPLPTTTPEPEALLKDIRPILALHDPFPWRWFWIILAFLALAVLIYWWWRRRKSRQTAKPTAIAIPLSPYEWFIQAMSGLESIRHDYVQYCHRLSFIFREYLERACAFPATDRTSEEILRDLRRTSALSGFFNDEQLTTVRQLFQRIDPVKYAASRPTQEDVAWAESTVRSLVEQQRPASPPEVTR
jgi:hypothetical protein